MRLVGKKKKSGGFLLQRKELLTVGAASALGCLDFFMTVKLDSSVLLVNVVSQTQSPFSAVCGTSTQWYSEIRDQGSGD